MRSQEKEEKHEKLREIDKEKDNKEELRKTEKRKRVVTTLPPQTAKNQDNTKLRLNKKKSLVLL